MKSRLLQIALAATLVIAWLRATGDATHWWVHWQIVLLDSIASVLAVIFTRKLVAGQKRGRVLVPVVASVGVGLWIVLSLIAIWTAPRLESDPNRFARIQPAQSLMPLTSKWTGLRIGLALSGGGYRAAVFHSGVLQALETLGIKVSHLSTVSGGSIIGAYYAVGGDPKRFVEAVAKGNFNLRRQLLLFHNAVRLPFPLLDRLDVQASLLHKLLFSRASLNGGLGPDEPQLGQPQLMIVATDLTYGFQVGLLPTGVLVRGDLHSYPIGGRFVRPVMPFTLAQRVAVSGAFPVAFPARQVAWRLDKDGGEIAFVLVDGGVRGNTGSDLARLADKMSRDVEVQLGLIPDWKLDALLVSDGGAAVGVAGDTNDPLELLGRVFDVATIGRETSDEIRDIKSYDTCREPVDLPEVFAPAVVRPEEGFPEKGFAWDAEVNLVGYPQEVVHEMIRVLPTEEQIALVQLLDRYLANRQTSAIDDATLHADVHQALKSGRTRVGASADLTLAIDLASAFHKRLVDDLNVFRSTSTLDATPSNASVNALERLGKLTVYLSWPHMQRLFDKAASCRQKPDPGTVGAQRGVRPK